MRAVVLAALLALSSCGAGAPAFAACHPYGPVAQHIAAMKAAGVEGEHVTDADVVVRFTALLRRMVDFDEQPTELLIAYLDDEVSKVGFILNGDLCKIIRGPPEGVRMMLKAARGQGA